MHATGKDPFSTFFLQGRGAAYQRPSSINHIVHDQSNASFHLPDHIHHFNCICVLATLVDDGQRHLKLLGECPRPLHTAGIGGNHRQIRELHLPKMLHGDGSSVKVIDGDVEITLDLTGVQVQSQNPIGSCFGDQIRHQL